KLRREGLRVRRSGTPIHTRANRLDRGKTQLVHGLLLLTLFLPARMLSQEDGGSADTRASQIQMERQEKASNLTPEDLTPAERHLTTFKDTFERLFQEGNLHLQLGGLPTGSGFAIGPVFQLSNSTDFVRVGFSAVGSVSQYYRVATGLTFPKFVARSLAVSLEASHTDAPRINYYGPGPNSRKGDRTDYRQEDTAGELSLRWAPLRQRLIMKAEGGEVRINIGPGTRNDVTSSELRYGPQQAPGIDVQTNFIRGSSSVELDGLDSVRDPHKGARLALQYQHYWDLKRDKYSFARASA